MTEILKRGTKKSKSYTWVCDGCESTLRSKESDGRYVSDRDGDSIVLSCPVCKAETWILATLFR